MSYSVKVMAEELMLDPSDVREIVEAFFEDAHPLLQEGKAAFQTGDRQLLSRKMHALKGSALNMRMESLGRLAAQAEKNAPFSDPELAEILTAIQNELAAVEASVISFYREGPE